MGNITSTITDNRFRMGQSERSLSDVAELIKNGSIRKIVVMTGAGISTAAGIPDFRSPETGLYHNLSRLNLPHPEAIFDIDFFREDPSPFYVLARELYPGNFHPTISHAFIALLAEKGLLRKLFTQNIDCLERAAGVPSHLIVEAHGSFATQRCIECKTPFPDDKMRECVAAGDPPSCLEQKCDGLVKPDIVFFGEQLPIEFHRSAGVPEEADLVIVLGTSLTVYPFAALPRRAQPGVPRILFNMEQVGDFGYRPNDVLCLGECDAGIRKLASELGWEKQLEKLWIGIVGEKEARRQKSKKGRDDAETEVDDLVREVESKLELSEDASVSWAASVPKIPGYEEPETASADAPADLRGASSKATTGEKTSTEEDVEKTEESAPSSEESTSQETTGEKVKEDGSRGDKSGGAPAAIETSGGTIDEEVGTRDSKPTL